MADTDKLIQEAEELIEYGVRVDDSYAGAIQQAQAKALVAIAKSLQELAAHETVEYSTELYKPSVDIVS